MKQNVRGGVKKTTQQKLLMLGNSLGSKEMVEYAKSLGVYTIVTDPREPTKSTAKLVSDEYWMINTGDYDQLEKKCREEGVTAVICGVSEFCLEACMELCKRLGFPCYCTPEAWHFSRDKADFKALCKEIGAPLPEDYYLSEALPEEELNNVKFPVVVKPVDMSGNRGISYCYDKNELVNAYKYARSVSKSNKIVVERMLKGKEWYSYYAIAEGEIRMIALMGMYAQPGELKNLYSLTTTVTDKVELYSQEIEPKIKEVLRKVGCKEGIAWVQEMLDEDGHFYIIEMGYRLPGDMTYEQYPAMINFDSIKWLVDYALGNKHKKEDLPAEQTHAFKKCGCSYSLWTNKEGILASIEGLDELVSTGKYRYFSLNQIGDHFAMHRPLGVLVFTADTIDDYCSNIDEINRTLSMKDEEGDDVIIRYTDFGYLKKIYQDGLNGK